MVDANEPCYPISVAARILGIQPQRLRYFERLGLIQPSRSPGKIRFYSEEDLARVRHVLRLTDDLGVNLAGVEVILSMTERMNQMEQEMERIRAAFEAEMQWIKEAAFDNNTEEYSTKEKEP